MEIWVCGTGTPAKQFSSTWSLSISSIFAARSTVLSNCKLICLIIVIDFHYGWFQIPYWDVLQNCEGQGQGLICHLKQINQNMVVANFCSAHIRSFKHFHCWFQGNEARYHLHINNCHVGSWTASELMLLNCAVGEDSWESLGLQGDPTSTSQRRSVLGVHWRDWCWSWNSNTLATWCEELTHLKRPWCWEGLGAGGEGDDEDEMVGWHDWLDGSGFGWTPGVGDGQGGLVCCGSWGHKESDTTERLNWTELRCRLAWSQPPQEPVTGSPGSYWRVFCHCALLFVATTSLCVCAKLIKSCPTLCDPMNCSLPGSSVHRILQARVMEWVSLLQEIFLTQDQTHVSYVSCVGRQVLYH